MLKIPSLLIINITYITTLNNTAYRIVNMHFSHYKTLNVQKRFISQFLWGKENNKLSGKNIHTTNYQYSESTSEICHQKQCLLAVVHVMDGLHVNNDRKTCSYWLVSSYIGMWCRLVMGWVGILNNRTDIVIFRQTDTDTNISIWNTEKYQIPTTKYQNFGSVLQVGF